MVEGVKSVCGAVHVYSSVLNMRGMKRNDSHAPALQYWLGKGMKSEAANMCQTIYMQCARMQRCACGAQLCDQMSDCKLCLVQVADCFHTGRVEV